MQNEKFISNHSYTEHVCNAPECIIMHTFGMIVSNREFNCFRKVVYLPFAWCHFYQNRVTDGTWHTLHSNGVFVHGHSRFLFQFSIFNFWSRLFFVFIQTLLYTDTCLLFHFDKLEKFPMYFCMLNFPYDE